MLICWAAEPFTKPLLSSSLNRGAPRRLIDGRPSLEGDAVNRIRVIPCWLVSGVFPEVSISTILSKQVCVTAFLHNSSGFHNDDSVGEASIGQPMADHEQQA
jgi:hypothetical protein